MFIDRSGKRIDSTRTQEAEATETASSELPNNPRLIRARVQQLLGGVIDFNDEVNLEAALLFPNNKRLFMLMVRHLSTDVPSMALNDEEADELKEALKNKKHSEGQSYDTPIKLKGVSETLEGFLSHEKKRLEYDDVLGVFPYDVVVSSLDEFHEIVERISTTLGVTHKEKISVQGVEQYSKIAEVISERNGLTLLYDENAHTDPNLHIGYLHSQDQLLSNIKRKGSSRILLIRFCDSTDPHQINVCLVLDDFRAGVIQAE